MTLTERWSYPLARAANVVVTGGLPPGPTANSARPQGSGAVGIFKVTVGIFKASSDTLKRAHRYGANT